MILFLMNAMHVLKFINKYIIMNINHNICWTLFKITILLAILALQEVKWPREGNLKSGNRNGKFENEVGFVINESIY